MPQSLGLCRDWRAIVAIGVIDLVIGHKKSSRTILWAGSSVVGSEADGAVVVGCPDEARAGKLNISAVRSAVGVRRCSSPSWPSSSDPSIRLFLRVQGRTGGQTGDARDDDDEESPPRTLDTSKAAEAAALSAFLFA
jgi:hypothetical protein